ncbi:MAG: S-layer homology domain-containing protein [Bacillota bacterium]
MLQKAVALVAVMVFLTGVLAGSALAEGKGKGNQSKGTAKISGTFSDMEGFEWGLGDVIRLWVQGIFMGQGDGKFAPGAAITHQEMAVATVRLMGAEAAAKALSDATVASLLSGIADADQIAGWARNYVAYLVSQGVVEGDEPFDPRAESKRITVAVILVKALGYTAEAQAKAGAELPFKDADEIPAELVGYVAAAVDHGLIKGYENNTFRPNRAVKRIEMGVMMSRADQQAGHGKGKGKEKRKEIRGSILDLDLANWELTIFTRGEEKSFTVDPTAAVFVDKAEAEFADLQTGMRVGLLLNEAGDAIYIDARTPDEDEAEDEAKVAGYITGLTAATNAALALIEIDEKPPFSVAADAQVELNGQAAAFTDLMVGDYVAVEVEMGLVTVITATRGSGNNNPPPVSTTTVSGTVVAIVPAGAGSPAYVLLTVNNQNSLYAVAANAAITLDGQPALVGSLLTGDQATLTLQNNVAIQIAAIRTSTFSGLVKGVTAAGGGNPAKLKLGRPVNSQTVVTEYPVAADAPVTVNGNTAAITGLMMDDAVTVTVTNGVVKQVTATRTFSETSGVVVIKVLPSGGSPGQITLSKDGVYTTYNVAANAMLLVSLSNDFSLANLPLGARAHVVKLVNNWVTEGIFEQPTITAVSLPIVSVTPGVNGHVIGTVQVQNGPFVLPVNIMDTTEILLNGSPATLSQIPANSFGEFVYANDLLIQLKVTTN